MCHVVGDGPDHGAARLRAVGPPADAVRHQKDEAARFRDEWREVVGRDARLVDAEQLVETRDQEVVLILAPYSAGVGQTEDVDLGGRRPRFGAPATRRHRGRKGGGTSCPCRRSRFRRAEHTEGTWPQRKAPSTAIGCRGFDFTPWAWVELNYRPHAYQACALTT